MNRIHSKAFWWHFKELINLINIEMHLLVVARGEINFLGWVCRNGWGGRFSSDWCWDWFGIIRLIVSFKLGLRLLKVCTKQDTRRPWYDIQGSRTMIIYKVNIYKICHHSEDIHVYCSTASHQSCCSSHWAWGRPIACLVKDIVSPADHSIWYVLLRALVVLY